MTPSIDRTLHQFLTITDVDLITEFDFYLIVQGFHRTYATGAACQQRTLTPPDTWSCPTLGLACVLMSRPISPELLNFEHPSVLLFCILLHVIMFTAEILGNGGVGVVKLWACGQRIRGSNPGLGTSIFRDEYIFLTWMSIGIIFSWYIIYM